MESVEKKKCFPLLWYFSTYIEIFQYWDSRDSIKLKMKVVHILVYIICKYIS